MRSSEGGTGRESDDGRAVVTRLSRPHVSGGSVTERAAIVAEGAADWIMAHAGHRRGGGCRGVDRAASRSTTASWVRMTLPTNGEATRQ
jgi:hypothetical protein